MTEPSFRRYTNLPSTMHILQNRALTMLDPANWDDRNDAYFIKLYKERTKAASVLALCFTEEFETYHHWRVFSGGSDGVCMEFDKSEVLKLIQSDSRYICKPVRYKNIKILNLKKPTVDQLPFTKRIGFKEEKELRILFVGKRKKMNLEQLSIPLGCIKRIILNPWMPKPLSTYVKRTLRGIDGCSNLKITRSTLIENETWKRIAESN